MQVEKYIGEVIWFEPRRGFGFISRAGEPDLFVHWSDIKVEGFKTLKKGQKVAYSIGLNKRKEPKATEVVIVDDVEFSLEKDVAATNTDPA
jgi:CspA family cold shock protein